MRKIGMSRTAILLPKPTWEKAAAFAKGYGEPGKN
jgi:hypothetical protein